MELTSLLLIHITVTLHDLSALLLTHLLPMPCPPCCLIDSVFVSQNCKASCFALLDKNTLTMWLKKPVWRVEILWELIGFNESLKKHNAKPKIHFKVFRRQNLTKFPFESIPQSYYRDTMPDLFSRHSAVLSRRECCLLLLQPCHLKFLFCFPPLHCKPEPSGGEPHKLLSSVSAFPSFSAACLHATTTH